MGQYVESGYSSGYVESDTSNESSVSSSDLIQVLEAIEELKNNQTALDAKLDSVLTALITNKNLSLNGIDKIAALQSSVNLLSATVDTISDNALKIEDIEAKIPFVDDKSLRIYPKGTVVSINGFNDDCIVESSSFLPVGDWDYRCIYTVSKEVEGEKVYSNFAANYVVETNPDEWVKKSDYPQFFPEA